LQSFTSVNYFQCESILACIEPGSSFNGLYNDEVLAHEADPRSADSVTLDSVLHSVTQD